MKHQKEKILWVTGHVAIKKYGITKQELKTMRIDNNNNGFLKVSDSGGYRYNANLLNQLLKTA